MGKRLHMTEKEYNAAPGVRRSDLWKISESPEKYLWAIHNPIEPTPAMVFGAAAHSFILEPKSFCEEYAIAPEGIDKRTKDGKERWEKFSNENEGKTIISADNYAVMSAMQDALCRCQMANNLIYGKGETELPLFWKDKDTGERCKVKLDRLVRLDKRFVVVDYKTAASAQTDRFVHDMIKYGYTLQAAMYTEAVMKCKRLKYRPDFIFVVQEKAEPYSVNVIYVANDSSVMMYGCDQFRELIGTLHQCKLTDDFYGYTGAFGEMSEAYLPGYISLSEDE